MYNGIGLLTPRGSGTSGHVQGNKFNLRGAPHVRTEPPKDGGPKQKQANQQILDHKKKREIELKVEQERERLEQEGVHTEADIEEILALFRAQELAKLSVNVNAVSNKLTDETHAMAQRKVEQMSKLKAAFGVKDDIREGDAFNRELQEQLKAQRMAEREAAQKAREEESKRREKEARRREKERAKEAKQREKEAKRREKEAKLREKEREEARRAEEERRRNASPEARLYRKYEAAPDRYDPYADEQRRGYDDRYDRDERRYDSASRDRDRDGAGEGRRGGMAPSVRDERGRDMPARDVERGRGRERGRDLDRMEDRDG
ncbi:hypothetical protein Agub_g815, partial [Astrephomene gubernaculifera]